MLKINNIDEDGEIKSYTFFKEEYDEEFPDPFKFVSMILDMSLETQMEIFPETGSTENIFKYYTYEEALDRYNKWYHKKES